MQEKPVRMWGKIGESQGRPREYLLTPRKVVAVINRQLNRPYCFVILLSKMNAA